MREIDVLKSKSGKAVSKEGPKKSASRPKM
jgi:hypothetical protein